MIEWKNTKMPNDWSIDMKRIKLNFLVFIIIVLSSGLVGCSNTPKAENSHAFSETENPNETDKVDLETNQTTTLPTSTNEQKEYNENLCTENEEILFSFKTENSDKILSVCVSKSAQEYIVYRFGTKEKVELEFPGDKADSWSKFIYSYYLRGGGKENEGMDMNYLVFENGGYEYEIYQEYTAVDESTIVGVRIKDKSTNKETDIKGLPDTLIGSLIGLRDNDKIKIEN
jgi:hypothetical protein